MSSIFSGITPSSRSTRSQMEGLSLYDRRGGRKYLTAKERRAFALAALRFAPAIRTFCFTLLFTGARISEALALTPERIDVANDAVVFETLKRRRSGVFRAIPVPSELILRLLSLADSSKGDRKSEQEARIWTWGRTTAWKHVKAVLEAAEIPKSVATPRAIRHAFGVNAIQAGIALNVLQRWMGHARIETTAIYADALGEEERALAHRTWATLRHLQL